MTEKMQVDWSTINLEAIRKYAYVNPKYRLANHMGAGCFLDAPGFPTYFLRNVYTQGGNEAPGYEVSLDGRALPISSHFTKNAEQDLKRWFPDREWKFYWNYTWDLGMHYRDAYYKTLWLSLPYEHERVQFWEAYVYSYFRNSWADPDFPEDDVRLWLLNEQGIDIRKRWNVSNFPWPYKPDRQEADNNPAYRLIRKFYPDAIYKPELAESGTYGGGNWWERLAHQPAPEECPGDEGLRKQHPVNDKWCQVCGWQAE